MAEILTESASEAARWCEGEPDNDELYRRRGRMRALTLLLALMAAPMLAALPAHAIPVPLSTTLSGANEVPPIVSPGTGQVRASLDAAANTLFLNVTFSGLLANTSAAHIHCCAPLGTNAAVATTVPAFPGFPLGVTAGSYSQTLDLTSVGSYNPQFITNNAGPPARPGMRSRPALMSIVDPAKSSPTGSRRPLRCLARKASTTAVNDRRFSTRPNPCPSSA